MWQFDSEQSLEAFVDTHLLELLDLRPLARQFYLSSQVCDLLAVSSQNQLMILELKNTEDRYIVQQLTRYYSTVLSHKPFADQVDYHLPIRLISIAPSFHAHNLIDRQYSRLEFEFYTFRVQQQASQLRFYLSHFDACWDRSIEIPKSFRPALIDRTLPVTVEVERKLPLPPKSLRRLADNLVFTEQDYLMQLRQQILTFSPQMQEVGRTTSTQYGLRKGESAMAELGRSHFRCNSATDASFAQKVL